MYGEILDGFKLVLVREGNEFNDMYVLMMHLFLIIAGLAIFLPGNPRNMEIDPSEPLIGVAISAYYILYDLQDLFLGIGSCQHHIPQLLLDK